MILAYALALLAQDAAPETIVITGRARPLHLSVQLDSKRRVRACQIAQSSGDEAFDRLSCETVAACSREEDRSTKAVQACTQAAMAATDRDLSGANSQ